MGRWRHGVMSLGNTGPMLLCFRGQGPPLPVSGEGGGWMNDGRCKADTGWVMVVAEAGCK